MKVVAFNGSPRKEGNTTRLIRRVFERLGEHGIETELVQLAGKPLRGCTACMGCAKNKNGLCTITDDDLNSYIKKMCAADGIIMASPTYFSDVTAEMKALIDRAGFVARVNQTLLTRKIGAAVVAVRRGGATHAFDTLNHFFLINEMIVPGSVYWNIGVGREAGDVQRDEEGLRTMDVLGENMAWLLKKVNA